MEYKVVWYGNGAKADTDEPVSELPTSFVRPYLATRRRYSVLRPEQTKERTMQRQDYKKGHLLTSTSLDRPEVFKHCRLLILILYLNDLTHLRLRASWHLCNARFCRSSSRSPPSDILARSEIV